MKKVLITGGSHAEVPLIQALKEKGYYVISTGNNLDGAGHKLADKYVPGDFSDCQFVCDLARKENIDGMVSGCNDFAYLSTAYACEELGICGHDTFRNAQLVHNKNKFMFACKKLGIVVPKTYEVSWIEAAILAAEIIKYPVILKPVDLTGGKGVSVCRDVDELRTAYERASELTRSRQLIVEEYVVGENHGGSFLVKNNKVIFSFFDNEQYYLNKYLVSGACYPSNVSEDCKRFLIEEIERFFDAHHLADGLFHFQFIINQKGIPVIIDPCRRSPGDLYISLVEYATGVNYAERIVDFELGKNSSEAFSVNEKNIARECIMTDGNGTYRGIKVAESIRDRIMSVYPLAAEGEAISNYHTFKAGIAFLEFDTREEMYDYVDKFHDLVTIERE